MAEINNDEKRIGVSGEQIEETVGKVPSIEADVKSNKQSISALQADVSKHAEDIAKNTADIALKANADNVYNKDETEAAITAKVAEIVAGAPEEFDTLKEMSDWLTEHSDSAAEMNTAIQTNTKAIADNAKAIEGNTAVIAQNKSDILSAQNIVIDYTAATPREKSFTFSRSTYGLSTMNTGALLVTLYDWSSLPTETNKSNLYLVSWSGGISYNYKCTVRIQPILATNPNLTLEIQSFTANDITFKAKTGMWTITPLHTGKQVSSTPVETTE